MKKRLDKFLVEQNYFLSREKARDAILQKTVKVNGKIVEKPSKEIEENSFIEIIDIFNRYVSRGGLKLEKAISVFDLDFNEKSILDVGASTGGFSDCALQHGARLCYAIDVGKEQLHSVLKKNEQIISIEERDFRDLTPQDVNFEKFDFITTDASFISLTYLLPYFSPFLAEYGQLILLIKPQFEAGASFLNKSGIVTDEKGYKTAIQRVVSEALHQGFYLHNLTISTLFELHKNVEFLALFSKKESFFKLHYPTLFDELKIVKNSLKNRFF